MSALRDAKRITTRADEAAHDLAWALVFIIVLLTAYSCVADEPRREVVMSRAEFNRAIAQARIDAAREALAAKECWPGDEFRFPPRKKAAAK